MEYVFDWDPKKAALNFRNHRVGFEEVDQTRCKIRLISARKATKKEAKQYQRDR